MDNKKTVHSSDEEFEVNFPKDGSWVFGLIAVVAALVAVYEVSMMAWPEISAVVAQIDSYVMR